ncbi:unnamed protein product [Chondrus crispus]|uniref:Uncharacterized protein n=1 Tax=Chondrus crispus TaxID=2769 RepID=R7QJJ7_CHOCR|nr:unnamed protein product [Chondrus crispus]CDF37918.1 unnamed protein product [Chondrus crispus]|eukprot:XP_005717789.1 unnamed protein product [Chondrus crispus]
MDASPVTDTSPRPKQVCQYSNYKVLWIYQRLYIKKKSRAWWNSCVLTSYLIRYYSRERYTSNSKEFQ